MGHENIAPVMFFVLAAFLLTGFPVAFALAANGLLFAFIGIEAGWLNAALLQALPQRLFGIMSNQVLLAIPFFTFMGIVLERSGMAEDLLDTNGRLFGPIRGGLALAVIFVGALLAATTGVVAASVIAMGLISLPIMLRYGYDNRLSTGVICASGTMAQIIPPSLVLIVLADVLGVSVGDMYAGAVVPSAILVGLLVLYVVAVAIVRPPALPALPREEWLPRTPESPLRALVDHLPLGLAAIGIYLLMRAGLGGLAAFGLAIALAFAWPVAFRRWRGVTYANALHAQASPLALLVLVVLMETLPAFEQSLWYYVGALALLLLIGQSRLGSPSHNRVITVLFPPLVLIFLVLGTIFLGVATPTEGGAMGAVGALALALARGRLNLKVLREAMDYSSRLTVFVMFVLIGSTIFALTFRAVDGDLWVEHLFTFVPGGMWGFIIVVNLLVFLLGFFIDFFEIAFIILPLLAPVAQKLGIDLIWFGLMIGVNLQTSFLTPPFGFALFYLRSVAPKTITTAQIYRGAVPFIAIQLLALAALMIWPEQINLLRSGAQQIDPDSVEIDLPDYGTSPAPSLQELIREQQQPAQAEPADKK